MERQIFCYFLSLVLLFSEIQQNESTKPKQTIEMNVKSAEEGHKQKGQSQIIDNPSNSDGPSDFFDVNEQSEEETEKKRKGKVAKNAIVERIISPKFSKIVGHKEKSIESQPNEDEECDKKDKAKVPDDSMKCTFCFDDIKFDQLGFCDHLMEDKIFDCSSSNGTEKESHAFCRECLQNYTEAAFESKPFARGWLGLKCVAEKCENSIPWQKIKKDASPDQLKAIEILENHCAELSVASAGLYLERCPKCNYAIDMDGPLRVSTNDTKNSRMFKSKQNAKLKFHCPECHFEMCRKCNEKWTDEHKNLTCEQLAKQQNKRNFRDNQLSENVVNGFTKCPKCKSPVEKIDGCNHVTCTCKFEFMYCCGAVYGIGHHAPNCTELY